MAVPDRQPSGAEPAPPPGVHATAHIAANVKNGPHAANATGARRALKSPVSMFPMFPKMSQDKTLIETSTAGYAH